MKIKNTGKKIINKKGNNDEKVIDFLKEQLRKANREIEKIEHDIKLLNRWK